MIPGLIYEILEPIRACAISDLGVMTNSWAALPYLTQKGQVSGYKGISKVVKLGPGTE